MLKVAFRTFSLWLLTSFVLIILLSDLFDDTLFFHSDPRSVFVFAGSLAAICAAALTVLTAPLCLIHGIRMRLPGVLSRILLILILSTFIIFLVDMFSRQVGLTVWLRDRRLEAAVPVLYGLILLGVARTTAGSGREEYSRRASSIALWFAPLAIALLILHQGAARFNVPGPPKPKRVVLVVLDAWPSYLMHSFNPEAKPRTLDNAFKKALLYRNARSVTPWTAGYFTNLYTGDPAANYRPWPSTLARWRNAMIHPQWNLYAALQRAGVRTRWIVWHNGGVPESKQVTAYQGLRSIFMTDRYAPMLDCFRLDYNLLISTPALKSIYDSRRKEWGADVLISNSSFDNSLTSLLLPEIRRMNRAPQKSFLLFHTFWALGKSSIPIAFTGDETIAMRKEAMERARKNDFKYHPEDEPYVEPVRRNFELSMDRSGERILEFLSAASKEGLLENTLLILTADHGEMADRGRIWYGFHPEEEVVRVPLIVFRGGDSGIDDRMCETRDLVKTIAEFLDARTAPDASSCSLFGSEARTSIASVTMRSDVNKEWFVVLYRGSWKYVANIHPKSDGTITRFLLDGFHTTVQESGPQVLQEIRAQLKAALRDLGVPPERMHPDYQKLALEP